MSTGFISSMNVSIKSFPSCRNILIGNFVDFLPCIGILTVRFSEECSLYCFIWILKLLILPNYSLGFVHLGLHEMLRVFGENSIDNFLLFSHQNVYSPKIPKNAITFGLSGHSKSSLSVTTGFISSSNVGIERFLLSEKITVDPWRSLRWTSDVTKVSKSFFSIWSNLDIPTQVTPKLLTLYLRSVSI